MNTDRITTITGLVIGLMIILEVFQILTNDQVTRLTIAAPMIVTGIAAIVQGFYTNK